jgi:hypothetical protein
MKSLVLASMMLALAIFMLIILQHIREYVDKLIPLVYNKLKVLVWR